MADLTHWKNDESVVRKKKKLSKGAKKGSTGRSKLKVHFALPTTVVGISDASVVAGQLLPCVWLAFRAHDRATDKPINLLAVWLTGSNITHVELVFGMPCQPRSVSDQRCKYMDRVNHAQCRHSVSFAIGSTIGATDSDSVEQRIDREYSKEGVWSFLQLKNISHDQLERMRQFSLYHMKRSTGYNTLGFLLNFWFPVEVGCRRKDVCDWKRPRRWFCSEFVTAALQYAGVDVPTHPCLTTPCFLFHWLVNNELCDHVMHASVTFANDVTMFENV